MVLCSRDRNNDLIVTTVCVRILAAVAGIARNFASGHGSRQVKGVVQHQIKCRPFSDFAIKVPILANVMDDKSRIESAQVVKQARIPAVSRKRAESRSAEAAIKINFKKSRWVRCPYYESIQVVAIEGEREHPEVAVAENRGIQLIASRVI